MILFIGSTILRKHNFWILDRHVQHSMVGAQLITVFHTQNVGLLLLWLILCRISGIKGVEMTTKTDRQKLLDVFAAFDVQYRETDHSIYAASRRFIFTDDGEIESILDYMDAIRKRQEEKLR